MEHLLNNLTRISIVADLSARNSYAVRSWYHRTTKWESKREQRIGIDKFRASHSEGTQSKEMQNFWILVLVSILLLSNISVIEAKKKSLFKERKQGRSKPSSLDDEFISDDDFERDVKLGGDGEEDVIKFNSEEDMKRKMAKLKQLRSHDGKDPILSDAELRELQDKEKELRKNVLRAALHHGDVSHEKAAAMHAMGRNLFKQQRYSSIYVIAWDILRIHEILDGPDSPEYTKALTNVASTAWKLNEREVARILTRRQLQIHRDHGESEEGKEVMYTRARLLSYKGGKEEVGLTHDEFKELVTKYDLSTVDDHIAGSGSDEF